MKIFDENFKEIFLSQFASVAGGLIVGTLISIYTNELLMLPGMLVMLPGFLEMRGSISGSFSARVCSGLFLGVINPKKPQRKMVNGNLWASFFMATVVSLALGLSAFIFNYIMLGQVVPKIIALPVIAGIIANGIEIPLTLFATLYLFRKGYDPNNIMGPFVTSTGDITSVLSLLFALVII